MLKALKVINQVIHFLFSTRKLGVFFIVGSFFAEIQLTYALLGLLFTCTAEITEAIRESKPSVNLHVDGEVIKLNEQENA